MPESANLLSDKAGRAPGTLVYVGEKPANQTKIDSIRFNDSDYSKEEVDALNIKAFIRTESSFITWLNITGLEDSETIENIGREFGIHFLALEDVLNTVQRPKIEEYPDCLLIVLKVPTKDSETNRINYDQVSIILKNNSVISFMNEDTNLFTPVEKRLNQKLGRIRKLNADYLAYALMDTIIDQYFSIVEIFDNEIENCEEALFESSKSSNLHLIHELKRNILLCRKTLMPIRELHRKIECIDSSLISENSYIYFRDLEDHINQLYDSVETFREMTASLLTVYHSNISNKMNEVMKVLTIISTIFIPLSFIAGVYGMNFKYMPELEFKYGYPVVIISVVVIALCMVLFFKRKNWL